MDRLGIDPQQLGGERIGVADFFILAGNNQSQAETVKQRLEVVFYVADRRQRGGRNPGLGKRPHDKGALRAGRDQRACLVFAALHPEAGGVALQAGFQKHPDGFPIDPVKQQFLD